MDLSVNSENNDPYDIVSEMSDELHVHDRTNLRTRSNRKDREERCLKRGRKSTKPERLLIHPREETINENMNQDEIKENYETPQQEQTETDDAEACSPPAKPGDCEDANAIPLTSDTAANDCASEQDSAHSYKNDDCDVQNSLSDEQPSISEAQTSQIQSPLLQALGLTRGFNNAAGIGNTISLPNSMTVMNSDGSKLGLNTVNIGNNSTPTTGLTTKTVPLLVNMKGNPGQTVPSILPANLPPGRYVIISSTTASSPSTPLTSITTTTSTPLTSITTSTSTTPLSTTQSSSLATLGLAAAIKRNHRFSLVRNSPGGELSLRTPVGKTRGMRKSYTTSEKLAMIEAVESGLKKSVVADRFGVAPSTLACIILQKDKIRRDQSKSSSLGRRRIRPHSSDHLPRLQPSSHFPTPSSSSSPPLPGGTSDHHHTAAVAGGGVRATPPFATYGQVATNIVSSYGAISSALASTGLLPGLVEQRPAALPFTHFLANFDQSMSFDSAPPEEIVSVPDLSESLPAYSVGRTQSTPASQLLYSTAAVAAAAAAGSTADEGREATVNTTSYQDTVSEEGDDGSPLDTAAAVASHILGLETAKEEADDSTHDDEAMTIVPDEVACDEDAPEDDALQQQGTGEGGGLSGLCLVKREVHCYSVLDQLMKDQTYTDVTLTSDGHTFHAHKIVLCMASTYFRRVLSDNSPGVRNVVVLRDISYTEMKNILQFLYTGEATVDASDLQSFMKTAQVLEISSLCDGTQNLTASAAAAASAGVATRPSFPVSNATNKTAAKIPAVDHHGQIRKLQQQHQQLQQQLQQQQLQRQQKLQEQQQQFQYYIQQHIKRQIALSRHNIQQQPQLIVPDLEMAAPTDEPSPSAFKAVKEEATAASGVTEQQSSKACNGQRLKIRVRSEDSLTGDVLQNDTDKAGTANDEVANIVDCPDRGRNRDLTADEIDEQDHVGDKCRKRTFEQGLCDDASMEEQCDTINSITVDDPLIKRLPVTLDSIIDAKPEELDAASHASLSQATDFLKLSNSAGCGLVEADSIGLVEADSIGLVGSDSIGLVGSDSVGLVECDSVGLVESASILSNHQQELDDQSAIPLKRRKLAQDVD